MSEVSGICDDKFGKVAELLARNIAQGGEIGASVFLNVAGQEVIDLWGGWRERERERKWSEDTIVNVFSGSKPVASLALLTLVERGQLDVDAPVAKYWPEFAQNGKEDVLVRHVMGHTAGLPAWEPPFTYLDAIDVPTSTARLAAQAPWWTPGARGSYHASTFGHLVSELFRRASGVELSAFIAREIAGPLEADFFLGLSDDQFARVATIYPEAEPAAKPAAQAAQAGQAGEPTEAEIIARRTRAGSFGSTMGDQFGVFNSPEWRRTQFAGSSGHANARGLGRIMSVISQGGASRGVKLLSPETINLIFQEQASGIDPYYTKPIRWGVGYALAPLEKKERGPLPFIRPGAKTCFWYGTGGSMALADVERGIAFGYAMNMCRGGRDQLNGQYYNAIYDALEEGLRKLG